MSALKADVDGILDLRPGERVEVRSEDEIRTTLDVNGMLEGLPMMPEMARFCGKVYEVHKRADKTCVDSYPMGRMNGTVFLKNVRCDGSGHDGCDRLCSIFWKEAWLKRAAPSAPAVNLSLQDLVADTGPRPDVDPEKTYVCQSTALLHATTALPWWSLAQYGKDMQKGQLGLAEFFKMVSILMINKVRRGLGMRESRRLWGKNTHTPRVSLGLQPGETVCLKSKDEIQQTLDSRGKTQGMEFSAEMTQFCGRTFTVLKRTDRMILETTGKMIPLRDSVLLEGVYCDGSSHRGCKRENLLFCKEAWLRRCP